MASTEQQIMADIMAHVRQCGGPYSSWYAGITADPQCRIFEDHCVVDGQHAYIWRRAHNSDAARSVERSLLDQYGFDGGPGGGDHTADVVYAYKKGQGTNP